MYIFQKSNSDSTNWWLFKVTDEGLLLANVKLINNKEYYGEEYLWSWDAITMIANSA